MKKRFLTNPQMVKLAIHCHHGFELLCVVGISGWDVIRIVVGVSCTDLIGMGISCRASGILPNHANREGSYIVVSGWVETFIIVIIQQ
jgi:hypothetical protein